MVSTQTSGHPLDTLIIEYTLMNREFELRTEMDVQQYRTTDFGS